MSEEKLSKEMRGTAKQKIHAVIDKHLEGIKDERVLQLISKFKERAVKSFFEETSAYYFQGAMWNVKPKGRRKSVFEDVLGSFCKEVEKTAVSFRKNADIFLKVLDGEMFIGQFVCFEFKNRKVYGKVTSVHKSPFAHLVDNAKENSPSFTFVVAASPPKQGLTTDWRRTYRVNWENFSSKHFFVVMNTFLDAKTRTTVKTIVDEHGEILGLYQTRKLNEITIVGADEVLSGLAIMLAKI
jgi:hypothetical protein